MKERYNNVRKRFNKIISLKTNEKDKRNKSFILSHKKYIEDETDSYNNSFNLTKNSFFVKEESKDYKNNKFMILDKKYNILKKSLEKLKILIEININSEKESTNDIINNINILKEKHINELTKEKKIMDNNLILIKDKYINEIENNEGNRICNDINMLKY